jgi:hypothetical protein
MVDPDGEMLTEHRGHLLDAWKVGEEVAMHFNTLLLGFRLKAIGGIAIAAVIGIGLKVGDFANPLVVLSIFISLAVIWILIWIIDFLYYYRLLVGAVDEILRLERRLGDIYLSHFIGRWVQGVVPSNDESDVSPHVPTTYPTKFPSWPIWVFYGLPELILVTIVIWLVYVRMA